MTVVTATAPTLWRAEKGVLLDGHSTHRQKPSPVSDGFKPPSMPRELRIRPEVLAAAMARTLTLRTAPDAMLAHWTRSQFAEIEYLITDGPQFQLSPFITALADAERSGFAGRVGAGICDLVMNVSGYVWRDNAECLSCKAAKHVDFIYAGGAATGHGVALAEAHGSFAQAVTKTTIGGEARRKYRRQAKPHVATSCPMVRWFTAIRSHSAAIRPVIIRTSMSRRRKLRCREGRGDRRVRRESGRVQDRFPHRSPSPHIDPIFC